MADNTPVSAEDEFGVSAEDEFGVSHSSFGGQFADAMFQNVHPFSTLLNNIGAGAKQGWGAVGDESETLNKISDTDYLKSKNEFIKGINDHFIRPAAYTAALIGQAPVRAVTAFGGAIYGAVEGTAEALGEAHRAIQNNPNIDPSTKMFASPLGAPAELAGIAASMPDLGGEFFAHTVTRARPTGAVGEGEKGFFNTVPVSPENLEARIEAAKALGIPELPPIEPPQTDIHAVARLIAPETFQEWDTLKELRDNFKVSLDYLSGKRGEEQERTITSILSRTGGDESALSEGEISRLANARDILSRAKSTESVQMAETRQRMIAADLKLRDLLPKIQDVKEHAQGMLEGMDKESAAFRDFVQAQALENSIKLQGIQDQVIEAYRNADALLPPEKPPTPPDKEIVPADSGPKETSPFTGKSVTPGDKGILVQGNRPGLKDIPGTGETKTRGLSKTVESEAIEKGLTESFSHLPEYKRINLKDQANKVSGLINTDPKLAFQIAMGKVPAPTGMIPEMVFNAIKDIARDANDVETLRQLATESDLVRQATIMAQRLRALAESVENTDPVAAMKIVQDARESILDSDKIKASKAKIIQEQKQALKNSAPKVDEWNSFLDDITCK